MNTTIVGRSPDAPSVYEPRNINAAMQLADTIVRSGLAPSSVKTKEQAFVIMAQGHELGLQPLQALRSIHVIQGKPCLSADLMVALVLASGQAEYWHVVTMTDDEVTIETQRRGDPKPTGRTWTMAMAQRSKLTGKDNWRLYPAAMLKARCASELARSVYPDVVLGLYTPDEMGALERDDGTVIDVRPAQSAPSSMTVAERLASGGNVNKRNAVTVEGDVVADEPRKLPAKSGKPITPDERAAKFLAYCDANATPDWMREVGERQIHVGTTDEPGDALTLIRRAIVGHLDPDAVLQHVDRDALAITPVVDLAAWAEHLGVDLGDGFTSESDAASMLDEVRRMGGEGADAQASLLAEMLRAGAP